MQSWVVYEIHAKLMDLLAYRNNEMFGLKEKFIVQSVAQ